MGGIDELTTVIRMLLYIKSDDPIYWPATVVTSTLSSISELDYLDSLTRATESVSFIAGSRLEESW